ncbi:Ger(x)C family spore germination protein [Caldalkalibacillus mannanilyticus]|uniref:Ger(x)C family spore germination protein n=1 Tax=Caldalkalibacillus mannanilyticus TaxID=1418 RepID=UPI0006847F18|nr:hypothetical protein [Caldalkalibacillus mannanilyticus]
MLPKIVKGILIIFILLLLTSCWNRRELNELSIASAIGIDALEDQKGYQVSVQILNPSEVVEGMGGGGYDTPVSLYTSTGETIHEAMRKMTKQVPNKVYLAHVRMVFLGEELAKQGIAKPLDFISRYRELRTDFYIAVTREVTAHQVLQLLTLSRSFQPTKCSIPWKPHQENGRRQMVFF